MRNMFAVVMVAAAFHPACQAAVENAKSVTSVEQLPAAPQTETKEEPEPGWDAGCARICRGDDPCEVRCTDNVQAEGVCGLQYFFALECERDGKKNCGEPFRVLDSCRKLREAYQ